MGRIVSLKGASAPAPGLAPSEPATKVRPSAAVESPDATDQPDLRLIIEDAEDTSGVVYTIVDRRTGKVVSRLSREDVMRLRQTSGYAAGAVFNGKA
jgi:flagellar protein FlaG